jgi:hypothetical protein
MSLAFACAGKNRARRVSLFHWIGKSGKAAIRVCYYRIWSYACQTGIRENHHLSFTQARKNEEKK